MDLRFIQGSPQEARGHALLYFDDASQPGRLLATYVVVLPVPVDLSRYLPPMFLSRLQMGHVDFADMSAFAFPPVPEPVDDARHLEALAQQRGDDLIHGGALSGDDLQHGLTVVSEAVQEYAHLYQASRERAPQPAGDEGGGGQLSVNEVLYELMSPHDRLNELSNLLGKLRFALDGPDQTLVEETEAEIRSLAEHFPQHYWVDALVAAARRQDSLGQRLAQLYFERCFRLADEEYDQARRLEEEITRLESAS